MADLEGSVQSQPVRETEATVETPTTNKVWDQSEHDRAVREAVLKATSNYSDYDQVKKAAAEAQEKLEALELKEKSELEQKEIQLSKALKEIEDNKNNLKLFQQKEARDKVLSDAKYSGLPAMYRNAVELSDNELDLQASADRVLEQYNSDFQVKQTSFGNPATPKKPEVKSDGLVKTAEDLKSRIAQKLNLI